MKLMRPTLSILFILLMTAANAVAKEAFSYLYIQGDKQTPFYVKLEDAMQPRFGKNYCIIPQLAPGPAHIEILFQQNVFPAQQFTVMIPENGSRGFLLVKQADSFALYDLQQGFYLSAGNTEADDHVPVAPTASAVVALNNTNETLAPTIKKESVAKKQTARKERKPERKPPAAKTVTTSGSEGKPAFIPDIELSGSGSATTKGNDPVTSTSTASSRPAITNSDCPSAISSAEFSKIFNAMSSNSSDEERLSFVMGKMDVCYESWQARALAQMLGGEAARFTLLKRIYPRITDQTAFALLDDLFSTEVWKAEFAKLVRH